MADEMGVPVQVALGDAGCSPSVEWKGKRYKLGHPTDKAKAFYCDGIVEAERRGVEAQLARRLITPAKYDEKIDDLGRAIDRNEHKKGGALWMRYAVGKDAAAGVMLFLWSLFAQHHEELTPADVEAIADANPSFVKLALRRVCPDFFEEVGQALRLTPEGRAQIREVVLSQLDRLFPEPTTDSGKTELPSTPC